MQSLPFETPYDAPGLLAFFASRAIPQAESIQEGVYRRVVRLQMDATEHIGWIEVRHTPTELLLTMSDALADVSHAVTQMVGRVFDVHAQPQVINNALGDLASDCPGLRLPGAFDPFEISVRAVLGQQITVKAARTLAQRLVQRFGQTVPTPFAELDRAFPSANTLARAPASALGELGIISRRSQAIIELARAFAHDAWDFEGPPDVLVDRLCGIAGIGPWTANYIVMRGCSHPDRWLPKDVVLLKALNLPKTAQGHQEAERLAQAWAPWRSYAVLHCWRQCV